MAAVAVRRELIGAEEGGPMERVWELRVGKQFRAGPRCSTIVWATEDFGRRREALSSGA